jgi:hypothetical protein
MLSCYDFKGGLSNFEATADEYLELIAMAPAILILTHRLTGIRRQHYL